MIGRGGMGAVYSARQRSLQRHVAIKILPISLADSPGFTTRFRQEALAMAGLNHPGIVSVYDSGETIAGHAFYVMELVQGMDLAQKLLTVKFSADEAVSLVATLCEALSYAHDQGVIHRDLKPSNILITAAGLPKLADFGLALLMEKNLELSRLTMGGTTLGTLEYAAPEQLDHGEISPASDQFSLGVLLYELLTGELPRGVFEPPSARNSDVDPAFDGVVLRALQSDPARRYESVAAFREALLKAADRRLQQANRALEARRKLRQRTLVAATAAGVALLTVGLAVLAWQQSQRAAAGETLANERRTVAEKAEKETEDVIQFLLTDLRKRLEKTGNLEAMESVLQRAVQHFRAKYDATNHAPNATAQLADALLVEADVLGARGHPEDALALFAESLQLAKGARAAEPGKASRTRRVAAALQDLSEYNKGIGRYPKALDYGQQMLEEAQRAMQLEPVPVSQQTLANAHRTLANAYGYLLDLKTARQEYLAARQIFQDLANAQPKVPLWAYELAAMEMSLGSLAEAEKDYPQMLQHFTAYHTFIKGAEGTKSHAYSHAALRLGLALILNKRADEAVSLLTDAIQIAEATVQAKPGDRVEMGHLRWCWNVFTQMQDQRGDTASAAEARRRMSALDAAIAATQEEDAAHLQERVTSKFLKAEQARFQELQQNPENDAAQYAWAMASEDLGKAIQANGDAAAARRHYERQLAKIEPLLAASAPDTWWNLGASYTLNRLGVLCEEQKQWAEGEPIFRRSLDLRRRTLKAHPGQDREPRNIASTAVRLARCYIGQDRAVEAKLLWLELFAELKSIPCVTNLEWRALLADEIHETLPHLSQADAKELTNAARDFLLESGEGNLRGAEKEALGRLAKFPQ